MALTRRSLGTGLFRAEPLPRAVEQGAAPNLAAAAPIPSKVYLFDQMPVHHGETFEYRSIVDGRTVDGCQISVHESVLAPKAEPHPPHHHTGEEIFLMLAGTLEVTINGASSRITRGSVAFIGSGDEHGIRNPGDTPARYYVVELGHHR